MSLQAIFDKTVNHLRKQNEKAAGHGHACQYRLVVDGRTLKCAVGIHIPDEEYNDTMEGHPVFDPASGGLMVEYLEERGFSRDAILLLNNLQRVHDAYRVEYWEDELKKVATDFKLIYTTKDES